MNQLLLFVCLSVIFVFAHGAVVSYVDTPACASSAGGCSFNDTIWNATKVHEGDTLIINSNNNNNNPITIFMNSTALNIFFIQIGTSGAPVTLIMTQSSLTLTANTSYTENNFHWGNTSALIMYDESEVNCYNALGGNLTLSGNSIFGATNGVSVTNLLMDSNSFLGGSLFAYVLNAIIIDSQVASTQLFSNSLYATNCQLSTGFTLINANITDCSFDDDITLFMNYNTSNVAFYNTPVTISILFLIQGGILSFFSNSPNNNLTILTVASPASGSEIHLGDNVVATFATGIYNDVTLDNNVTLILGVNSTNTVTIEDIEQYEFGAITSITVIGTVFMSNTAPIAASIELITLQANGLLQLNNFYLSPGSVIFGEGSIVVMGPIICPGSSISVLGVFWESGNITATQVTASYMGPFSFIDPQIIINGDVVINNPNYGINLASGYTHISGDYTQIGGAVNMTISNYNFIPTFAHLQAGGVVTLEGVIIRANINLTPGVTESNKFLIVSAQSYNSTNTTLQVSGADTSLAVHFGSSTDNKGDFYLTFGTPGNNNNNNNKKSFWKAHGLILAVCAGGLAVLALLGIVIMVVNRRRHSYQPV